MSTARDSKGGQQRGEVYGLKFKGVGVSRLRGTDSEYSKGTAMVDSKV